MHILVRTSIVLTLERPHGKGEEGRFPLIVPMRKRRPELCGEWGPGSVSESRGWGGSSPQTVRPGVSERAHGEAMAGKPAENCVAGTAQGSLPSWAGAARGELAPLWLMRKPQPRERGQLLVRGHTAGDWHS